MSRQLTENQIAQIIHDFSDSESEGIEDTAQENILEEHNIIEERTGLKGPALSKNEMSPVETWELLLTDDIIQLIVQYTNQS
ncbi:hypothetical protein EVAR_51576_1 [Eumeta japonica]|uniref:Uncharacterized protein n=1 Tax=Eumeta variegata TaxID=151549 RepID=A0A4C1YE45_EUMVA|nr:hypothetical protein EVAR_51576_1 [Eumeta japonica]